MCCVPSSQKHANGYHDLFSRVVVVVGGAGGGIVAFVLLYFIIIHRRGGHLIPRGSSVLLLGRVKSML